MPENIPPTPPPATQTVQITSEGSPVRNWSSGQILQAVVSQSLASNQAIIQIGNLKISAQTSIPVTAGEKLTLEVVETGKLPLLRILRPLSDGALLENLIRSALPKQSGLPPLLANLQQAAQTDNPHKLPAPVLKAVQEIIARLPDSSSISRPEVLRNAIQQSGIFLESKLAEAARVSKPADIAASTRPVITTAQYQALQTAIHTDTKTGLLRLQQQLLNVIKQDNTSNTIQYPASHYAKRFALQPDLIQSARPLSQDTLKQIAATVIRPATAQLAPLSLNLAATGNPATGNLSNPLDIVSRLLPALQSLYPPPANLYAGTPQPPAAATLLNTDNLRQLLNLLLGQTEASLSRLQLLQTLSHPLETDQKPAWILELPVRYQERTDVFQLRISRDREQQDNESGDKQPEHWMIQIAFELEELGPVRARVRLAANELNAVFWMEQEQTTMLFRRHLGSLQQKLEAAGIGIGQITCMTGIPPSILNQDRERNVFSEKA